MQPTGEARGRAGNQFREDEMSAGDAAPNLYLTVRPRLARNDSNVRPIRSSRPGGPAAKRQPSPQGLGINSAKMMSAPGAAPNLYLIVCPRLIWND
jgi:hypothetical protein